MLTVDRTLLIGLDSGSWNINPTGKPGTELMVMDAGKKQREVVINLPSSTFVGYSHIELLF